MLNYSGLTDYSDTTIRSSLRRVATLSVRRQRSRNASRRLFAALVIGLAAIASACTATPTNPSPTTTGDSATTSSGSVDTATARATGPEEITRQVTLFLSPGGRYDDLITSILVTVDGRTVVEHYGANGGPNVTGNVYSVTKSVMSMLIGIAIEEGSIAGVEQTLGQLLPNYRPSMSDVVASITLEQLLTMQGGYSRDGLPSKYLPTTDWTAATLESPLAHPPGDEFQYSNIGAHLLSAILTAATGRTVLDYAREKLFGPLGIATEPAAQPLAFYEPLADAAQGFAWSVDPQGLNLGSSELKITSGEMAKLGQLYLEGGQWAGQQIVPRQWVTASTQARVDSDKSTLTGYGYLWWVGQADGHPAFAAVGSGGQLVEVVPELGLVVVVSALDDPAAFDSFSLASMVGNHIAPAIG